eukprot:gnl/Hemi2/4266_TR1487_c0_g1_i1.p1 gnl/Hemi2/4266_TR1487_c0_g1~~gnl/Hemi2/4266_TR1487_c0_g1_i1.p1  ORF type:complete len:315 (+),score=60.97 gnl/Hemi2/4266_TR1487_c0_g1_i1:52-945(+)
MLFSGKFPVVALQPRYPLLAALLVLVWVLVLASLGHFSFVLAGTNPWKSWEYDPGPWCELERTDQLVREPSNSWSDFGFLAVTLHILYCTIVDFLAPPKNGVGANLLLSHPSLSLLNFLGNITHFVGTLWNHSCRCHVGHVVDVAGMYSIVWFVCLYSGYRLFPRRKASLLTHAFVVTLYVAGFVFLGVLSDPWYRDAWCEAREKTVMSTMIFFTCVFNALHYFWNMRTRRVEGNVLFPLLTVALMILGFTWHCLDRFKVVCWPTFFLQGHAIWHLTTAGGLYLMYRSFYSEEVRQS